MDQALATILEYWAAFVAFADKHPLIVWGTISGLINLAIAERSRVDAWCERHPYAAIPLKAIRAFGLDPWHLAAVLSLLVNKRLPEASKRSTSLPKIPLPLLVLPLLLLVGCTGSLEQSRAAGANDRKFGLAANGAGTPERCAELDDRRQFAGMVAKGGAALAGGAGLAAVPVDEPDQRDLRVGLAIGAAVAGAAAVGAQLLSEAAGESWSRECATR